MSADTIYAVSSGRPPAAIAIMRVSGAEAGNALSALAGRVPAPRLATVRTLRSAAGDILDRALVLWFPGPASATGEDVAEFHLHGGGAVVDAVAAALARLGLRLAQPGEFTRRAVLNGRLDLNEAEGLADLLAAETETQRREAMLRTTGTLAREFADWTARLLAIAATIELTVDHDGEGEAAPETAAPLRALLADVTAALARASAERLRDGVRVAIVGPVNAGKSSLFNLLVGSDAAIVTPIAGTTRDVVERSVSIGGVPFLISDTAGLREADDPVEKIGIERARAAEETADIILDLSGDSMPDPRRLVISAKADLGGAGDEGLAVSARTGAGYERLVEQLVQRATALIPADGEVGITRRQRSGIEGVAHALSAALDENDPVIVAFHLATARCGLDLLTGRAGVEDLLDTLFSRFCLGK